MTSARPTPGGRFAGTSNRSTTRVVLVSDENVFIVIRITVRTVSADLRGLRPLGAPHCCTAVLTQVGRERCCPKACSRLSYDDRSGTARRRCEAKEQTRRVV